MPQLTYTSRSANLLYYATPRSAGLDLAVSSNCTIEPRSSALLPTGVVIQLPPDHVALLVPRSSTFPRHGLLIPNSPGVIDPDFCGPEDEIRISVFNPHNYAVSLLAGTRIAQLLVLYVPRPTPLLYVDSATHREPNRGSFGSTDEVTK